MICQICSNIAGNVAVATSCIAKDLREQYIDSLNKRAKGPSYNPSTPRMIAGWIPVISTFTGAIRVVKYTVLLFHDIIAIPTVRKQNRREQDVSFCTGDSLEGTLRAIVHDIAYIARGLVEMVPIVGNISMFGHDCIWMVKALRKGF